jgi:transmembrane sensor
MKMKHVSPLMAIALSTVTCSQLSKRDSDKLLLANIKSAYSFQKTPQVFWLASDSVTLKTELLYWGSTSTKNRIMRNLKDSSYETGKIKSNQYYLTVNKSEQYKAEPDGDKRIWINSASSLILNYRQRRLHSLDAFNGQGYYESNKDSLLVTLTDSLQISAKAGSGIHILNYGDEPAIKIVLIKGKADLKGKFKEQFIDVSLKSPGDLVQIDRKTGQLKKSICDVDKITAWDNTDYFRFEAVNLSTIARVFSRWYDMPVIFSGVIPEFSMDGSLPYNVSIESNFKILEAIGPVKFNIKNDSIFVTSSQ